MKIQLKKQLIYDQLKALVEAMAEKDEWGSVKRHLLRAMLAAEDLIKKKA